MLEFQRSFFIALHGFLDEILDERQQIGGQFDDGARRQFDDVAVIRNSLQSVRKRNWRAVRRLQLTGRFEPIFRLVSCRNGEFGL